MTEKVYDKNAKKEYYSRKGTSDYLEGRCTHCGGVYEDSKISESLRTVSGADPVCSTDCFVANEKRKGDLL